MVVQHNLQAMNSNRFLGITQGTLSKSTEKLSSGYKINRAADNAAGLAISEKMRKQVRGLTQASSNAEDGISSVQTAEGALTEIHDMLQRMNELAVQSANGTNSSDDRSYIQDEIDQLSQEIDRVAETTKFNETYLLKGDRQAVKGYSFAYKTLTEDAATALGGEAMKGAASINGGAAMTDAATNLSLAVDFTGATVSSTYQNALAKAVRDQGVTISVTTGKSSAAADNVAVLTLNGSDANAMFDVVKDPADTTNGKFIIKTADGKQVAAMTVTGHTAAAIVPGQTTANITASKYTVKAAAVKGERFALYDKDGNRIAENALQKYFSGADDKATARADAPSVYDALGNKYVIGSDAFKAITDDTDGMIAANQDQTAALKMSFHVGADGTLNNKININIDAMSAKGLGVNGLKVDGNNGNNATNAIDTISAAIKKVSTQRSALGAVQNRLEHTIKNLDNIVENTTAAESAIRDTDMASEMVTYSNNNILSQAGQSMLAQSNQSNQGVLSILG